MYLVLFLAASPALLFLVLLARFDYGKCEFDPNYWKEEKPQR